MKKQKVIFRADGNATIGLGHIYRCLALMDMIKQDFECYFATQNNTQAIEVIKNHISDPEKLILLPEGDDHFATFLEKLSGDEIVVLDNYFFTSDYQKQIKSIGCKLICIDDIPKKHFYADIIINHSSSANPNQYSKESYTKTLFGLDYVLLRKEFLNIPLPKEQQHTNLKVMVCFGGADPANLTGRFTKELSTLNLVQSINIIIGNAFPKSRLDEIQKIVTDKEISIHQGISASEMASLMRKVDLGVVPCSGILMECLSQNLPVITGYYIDNQKGIASALTERNIGYVAGDLKSFHISDQVIKQTISSSFDDGLIDGKSGVRLLKSFKALVSDES